MPKGEASLRIPQAQDTDLTNSDYGGVLTVRRTQLSANRAQRRDATRTLSDYSEETEGKQTMVVHEIRRWPFNTAESARRNRTGASR